MFQSVFHSEFVLRVVLGVLSIVVYYNEHHIQGTVPGVRSLKSELPMIVAPVLWTLSLALYVFDVSFLNYGFELPFWLRWVGVVLLAACLPLTSWAHGALGNSYSPRVELRHAHTLVSHGPYRFVRHPMYATLVLCAVATCLISASWLVVATTGVVAIVLLGRIRKEEAMLERAFGERYITYKRTRGAFLPWRIL